MLLIQKIIFTLALLVSLGKLCIAQTYNFKNYSTEEGLPQSQVLSIYQDYKGYMWFGTNGGGVCKFDGNTFKTLSENEGLLNNRVFSITENHKNELLFGTTKGLCVYNGISFENYAEKEGLANSYIFKVVRDEKQTWIGTLEGVFIFKDSKISRFDKNSILNKSSVYTIFVDEDKNIWFGTIDNGVVYYDRKNDVFRHFGVKDGLKNSLIFSIAQIPHGDVLIGTKTGLNSINKQFQIKEMPIPHNENMAFSCLLMDSKNEFYFGTYAEGLIKFDVAKSARTHNFNVTNGFTTKQIQCLFKDRENNIWIGTDGSGAYKYSNSKFTYYTKSNGLPENYINAVAQDKNENYWVGLRNNGLVKINGNTTQVYKSNQPKKNCISDDNTNVILPAKDGKLYFGTNEGLCSFENEVFTQISDKNFKEKYILSLYEDSKNNIWIGTNEGLYNLKNNTIAAVEEINSLKNAGTEFAIYTIIEDKYGSMWIGTATQLIKLNNSDISIYDENSNFANCTVFASIKDYKGNLWFGTSSGVFNYNYKDFTPITQKNGLSSNNVNAIQIDNNHNLIVNLNTGIDKIDLNEFYKSKIKISHIGKHDGLLNLESNYSSSFKDKDGKILIGTIGGLEIYDPKYDIKNKQEALISINEVLLFSGQEDISKYATGIDSSSLLPKNLSLPFNKNHITFRFIGISLTAPEKVMYQIKLEGLDKDWTPATSKTEIPYSSLPPGSYTFMIKAMNNDGVWNKEPITYSFEIAPPWYNTWWFYGVSIIIVISGIWAYNYLHTQKLIADKQKLEGQVTERTKELRKEKEKVEIINKEVIEQKNLIEHHNIEIMDSIKYAKNIQEALLPSLNEINTLFEDCFILYMPKDIVSGDFYWFAKNGDTRFIAAVDCTGHGVPGAFMSIVGNTLLNEIINEKKITTPSDILLELHKGVKIALNQNAMEFERRDGMDITLCAFKDNSNIIEYAGANRPLWIYRKNKNYELEVISANKFPIGGLEFEYKRTYQNHTIEVHEGDCLYLFSDGFADQFGGPKGKKFMVSNLKKVLYANINNSMKVQKQNLTTEFLNWKGSSEQIDDVLVIGLKI